MKNFDDNRLQNYGIIGLSIILWIVGLSYGSGIGQVYDVYKKTERAIILLSLLVFLIDKSPKRITSGSFIIAMLVIGCEVAAQVQYGRTFFDYLWIYLIVYIYSKNRISKMDLMIIGLAYGTLGLFVLFAANFTSVLAGWDGNSISMVSFFSYTVFASGVLEKRDGWKFTVFVVYSLIFAVLLTTLNSRSSVLFSAFLVLAILNIIPMRKFYRKCRINLFLFAPLLIAVFIASIKDLPFAQTLNDWSYNTFQKPIFNGRDEFWSYGLEVFFANPLFGIGTLGGNWHNSAITTLVGAGLCGYIALIGFMRRCWRKACSFVSDFHVYCFLSACVSIWLQQTVELGLVQQRGNAILFVIIGLLMGRVKTVRDMQLHEQRKNLGYV